MLRTDGRPATIVAQRRLHVSHVVRSWKWPLPALMGDGAPQPGYGWRVAWEDADEE
jgi:hypothetical protein